MQGAKCAISKLVCGLSVCTDDNHSLNLAAYRLVHTDEPYINLHFLSQRNTFISHFRLTSLNEYEKRHCESDVACAILDIL